MSRAARRRQSHGLHIFLTVILVILTACVVVKAFFLKAPEQKAAELPASQPAEEENSPSDEEQAAQEKIIRAAIAKAKNLFIPQISIDSLFCFPVIQCLEATDIHYLRRANGSTDRQPSLHL